MDLGAWLVGIALLVSLFHDGRLLSWRWALPVVAELVAVLIWIFLLGGAIWPHRGPLMFAEAARGDAADPCAVRAAGAAALPDHRCWRCYGLGGRRDRALSPIARRSSGSGYVVRLRGRLYGARGHHRVFARSDHPALIHCFSSLIYSAEGAGVRRRPGGESASPSLRYRLSDIDIIVRALLYATLTATLALLYFGSVVLLNELLARGGGQESDLVIIISTLVIARCSASARAPQAAILTDVSTAKI